MHDERKDHFVFLAWIIPIKSTKNDNSLFFFPFVMVCTSRGRCLYVMGITIKSRTNCFECSKSHNSATRATTDLKLYSFKRVRENLSLSGAGWMDSTWFVVSPCWKIDIASIWVLVGHFVCGVYREEDIPFKVCNIFILLHEYDQGGYKEWKIGLVN